MSDQKGETVYEVNTDWDFPTGRQMPIKDLLGHINQQVEKIPAEYREAAIVCVPETFEGWFCYQYPRPETAEEAAIRERRQCHIKEQEKQRDLAELARLKEKYPEHVTLREELSTQLSGERHV